MLSLSSILRYDIWLILSKKNPFENLLGDVLLEDGVTATRI